MAAVDYYVNPAEGNASYDGLSPFYVSGTNGPQRTLYGGIWRANSDGRTEINLHLVGNTVESQPLSTKDFATLKTVNYMGYLGTTYSVTFSASVTAIYFATYHNITLTFNHINITAYAGNYAIRCTRNGCVFSFSNGTLTGANNQVLLTVDSTSTATSTITFTNATLVSSYLTGNCIAATSPMDSITFDNTSLTTVGTFAGTNMHWISFSGALNNLNILNGSVITLSQNPSTSDYGMIFFASTGIANIDIEDSTFNYTGLVPSEPAEDAYSPVPFHFADNVVPNIIFSNNTWNATNAGGITLRQGTNITVSNNEVDINASSNSYQTTAISVGIDAQDPGSLYVLGNVLIHDNEINYTGAGGGHGILIGAGTSGAEMYNNETHGGTYGSVIKGDGAYVHHNVLDPTDGLSTVSSGILLKQCQNAIVEYNTIIGQTTACLGGAAALDNEWENNCSVQHNVCIFEGASTGALMNFRVDSAVPPYTTDAAKRNYYDYNLLFCSGSRPLGANFWEAAYYSRYADVRARWVVAAKGTTINNDINSLEILDNPLNADYTLVEKYSGLDAGAFPLPIPTVTITNISATAVPIAVTLVWTSSGAATSYSIKRSTTSGGPYTTIGTSASATYTDTTADYNTAYYYVVSIVNANIGPIGTQEGSNSGEDSILVPNTAPAVTIEAIIDDILIATAIDVEEGDISSNIVWIIDGYVVGFGSSYDTSELSPGTYLVTASATDSYGLTGSDTVELEVAQHHYIDPRNEGTYGVLGQDASYEDTSSGATHTTARDEGSYSEIIKDIYVETDSGATVTTARTDGSYGVFGTASEVTLTDSGATVVSDREDGSYGTGTAKSEIVNTSSGATVYSERTDSTYGAR